MKRLLWVTLLFSLFSCSKNADKSITINNESPAINSTSRTITNSELSAEENAIIKEYTDALNIDEDFLENFNIDMQLFNMQKEMSKNITPGSLELLQNEVNASINNDGAVPEPHEWLLIIIGLTTLFFYYRKQKMLN